MTVLTIVGAGLIGCSFARAARNAGLFDAIHAVEPDARHAERAVGLGCVDGLVDAPPAGSAVLLACPATDVIGWVRRLAEHDGIVFDVASVKGAVIGRVREAGGMPGNFVPCHPIAGREKSGPDAADATLFAGRPVILTPVGETREDCLSAVREWWRRIGAEARLMDPLEHDRVYARTSHLPHLLAFVYLLGIEPGDLDHSGGGFRDFSRIGASDPDMWSSIFDLNADALLDACAGFRERLDGFVAAIRSGDTAACRGLIEQARSRRTDLPDEGEARGG